MEGGSAQCSALLQFSVLTEGAEQTVLAFLDTMYSVHIKKLFSNK